MKNQLNSSLSKYGQYTGDLFSKLDVDFQAGKTILDVGCGPGTDTEVFINEYGLDVYGIDIYKHERIDNIPQLKFTQASIFSIPFEDNFFDYIFLHDVLHHIDEEFQNYETHILAIKEILRVVKDDGLIVIVEANRYNPLFFPHMVKMLGHNHWRQSYFRKVVKSATEQAQFRYFESHLYPSNWLFFWKIYEKLMEILSPKEFLAYNVAIINKPKL